MIPGIGENRIDGNLTGNAMIPVPDIAAIGIGGDDRFRPVKPDHAHNLFPKFRCVFKSLIRILQKYHFTHSQNFSSGPLLALPDFGQHRNGAVVKLWAGGGGSDDGGRRYCALCFKAPGQGAPHLFQPRSATDVDRCAPPG